MLQVFFLIEATQDRCGLERRACPFKCHHSIIHDVPYEDEVDAGVRPASSRSGTFIEEMSESMVASTALE